MKTDQIEMNQVKMNLVNEFMDNFIVKAGLAVLVSRKIKEPFVTFELSILLKPSLLKTLTEGLEPIQNPSLSKEEREKSLSQGIAAFLHDAIEEGILFKATKIADRKLKEMGQSESIIQNLEQKPN